MDYAKSAKEVLELVGGPANVASAAHCVTRLRLVIADNSKVNKEAIEDVEGVKGVFEAQGQLQIIFGTGTVNKVYDEFVTAGGITGVSKAEAKEAAAAKQNPLISMVFNFLAVRTVPYLLPIKFTICNSSSNTKRDSLICRPEKYIKTITIMLMYCLCIILSKP